MKLRPERSSCPPIPCSQEHHDSDSLRLPQYRLTPRTVSQPVAARAEATAKPERQSSSLVIRTSRRPRAIRPAKPRSPAGPSPAQSPAIPDVYRHTGGIGEPSPTISGPGPSSASGLFPPGTVSPSNGSFSDSSSTREVSPWRPQGAGALDRGGGHPITPRYSLPQLNESHQLPDTNSTGSSTTPHQSGYTTLVPTPATHREYSSRHSYPSTPSFPSSNYSSPNSTNDHHSNHQNHASTNVHANYNEPVQPAYQYQRVTYNAQPSNVSYPLDYDADYNQYNPYGYYMSFPEQQHRTP
ncbi:hypothetical protein BDM02DRAFT_2070990 [Thelephora ganbajun]|uniref:Uncharacterized protein n=1 Tax=Thelephora ganbajun TaxID=370292 RepID=A0ACB6ZHC9_THEGA|nr:hypothetical protein BDM02DRAFT_2070990 [Thelephora ganbajun]